MKELGPADVGVSLKKTKNEELITIGYFRSLGPLYQNEVEWSAFDMITIFHSNVKKVIFTRTVVHFPHFESEGFWNSEVAYFHWHSIVLCNNGYPRHSWILDSTQWIPDCSTVKIGFRILIASKILYSLSWITDSKARESEFHEQKFPGSRIPQAKISQIVESGLP